jgi:hypothetical protein
LLKTGIADRDVGIYLGENKRKRGKWEKPIELMKSTKTNENERFQFQQWKSPTAPSPAVGTFWRVNPKQWRWLSGRGIVCKNCYFFLLDTPIQTFTYIYKRANFSTNYQINY